MKLLIIHNNYGAYTGEEAVVERQAALFAEMGHTVSVYRKSTEGQRGTLKGNIKGIMQGFYSPNAIKEIKKILATDCPDVAIIHNLYPYISPAILPHISKAGVAIVMTVHNYRLKCPTGLFMRDYKPCELCMHGKEWNCIKYNCEQSFIKSLGYAGRNWYARKTRAFLDNIDVYACITAFQKQKLIEAGYSEKRITVIPNFIHSVHEPSYTAGEYVAISGRVSREKGIDLILEVAAKTPEIPYLFAGAVREEDMHLLKDLPANCKLLGHLTQDALSDFYANARFMLMASRWYEGFPMTVLDAFSYGKPVIGPAHAGFLEIIDDGINGLHFTPSDGEDLAKKIEQLWNEPDTCVTMGRNAYQKLQQNYTQEVIKKQWSELFESLKQE